MQKQVIFKTKGMQRDLSVSAFNSEFSYENMISIDLFDKITKYLYNQNKTLKFFSPLEYFYTLIEDYKPESENYIMCYINQQKYFKL